MVDFDKLKAPFAADKISWRIGSTSGDKKMALALAYIDARDVMERLDEVCGPAGWGNKYSHANGKTVCDIDVKCGEEWISKADGAGDSDVEAEKGALSDAFKRAAVRWGIGRYLYEDKFKGIWVPIEAAGKGYKITADGYNKLSVIANGKKPKTPTPHENPLLPRIKQFEQAMDQCKSLDALNIVIKKGNDLLKELHTSLPDAHDQLQKKISQHQEAFVMAQQ